MTDRELAKRIEEGIPFILHVADGRSFEVPHRDFIWLQPKSTVVCVAEYTDDSESETVTNIVPLLMVSGVTMLGPVEQSPT